ncbi:MAG TPA: response regulator [Candidatus Limnocylindrales bacterium]|nr:response regulator [Candidatus Limnocylindrales bacterium]
MARVLIVDDEVAILGLLATAFKRAGYDVATAKSGEEAIAMAETSRYDAVLSDVSMSGMDGHQTVSRIRMQRPGTVAVLMSGVHIECTGACCVPVQHCTWLQKPFSPKAAVDMIAERLAAVPKVQ